jgi:hypothetical protein
LQIYLIPRLNHERHQNPSKKPRVVSARLMS